MKPLPNALRQELARSQTAGPHPDADLLTAFSENALIGRERDDVLTHLAQCASCRAIVHLGETTASDSSITAAAAPSRSPRRLWVPFFAAAGIATTAAVTVILLHRSTAPAIPAPVEVAANPQPPVASPQLAASTPSPPQFAKKAMRAHAATPEKPLAKSEASQNRPMQSAVAQLDLVQPQQQFERRALQQAPSQQAKLAPESKALEPLSAAGFAGNASAAAARTAPVAVRAHWRLTATGQVERAIGEGPWQTVLATPHMRVISVSGSDIWAGGDDLRLLHSADNGNSWLTVALPAKTAPTHAITHIRAQSATSLTVEADDGTVWTTTDGGITWQ